MPTSWAVRTEWWLKTQPASLANSYTPALELSNQVQNRVYNPVHSPVQSPCRVQVLYLPQPQWTYWARSFWCPEIEWKECSRSAINLAIRKSCSQVPPYRNRETAWKISSHAPWYVMSGLVIEILPMHLSRCMCATRPLLEFLDAEVTTDPTGKLFHC